MPELKNTFTSGRMDKDQDERILGSGLYREALNIEVATSEDSDVGAAQNVLGNIKVTEAISGPKKDYSNCAIASDSENRYLGTNSHIAHVVDPQNDKLYRFINTTPTASGQGSHGVWMDRIVEYNTNSNVQDPWQTKERAVMVDIYKVETTISGFSSPPNPPSAKYICRNGVCTQCGPGTGIPCGANTTYTTPNCNNACTQIEVSYNCVNNTCVDPGDGSGQYSSLAACNADLVLSLINSRS